MYGWDADDGFFCSNIYDLTPADAFLDVYSICRDWADNAHGGHSVVLLTNISPLIASDLLREKKWRRILANEVESIRVDAINAGQAPDELNYLIDICDSDILSGEGK